MSSTSVAAGNTVTGLNICVCYTTACRGQCCDGLSGTKSSASFEHTTTDLVDACTAGATPDMAPIKNANERHPNISMKGNTGAKTPNPALAAKLPAADAMLHPKNIPKAPPTRPKNPDSIKKIHSISLFLAPIDFIIPISLVLSITAITSVLMIPKEAASRATSANTLRPTCSIPIAS